MSFKTYSKLQKLTLLIDADLFLFRATAACEEEIEWDTDLWSLNCDVKKAKEIFKNQIEDWCKLFGTSEFILCFSDRENFRKEVYKDYKFSRKKSRKPVGYRAIVDWAKQNYSYALEPFLEADDILGIISTHPKNKGNTIVISDDKDMKTIPCHLFRPMNGEETVITEEEADRHFLTQCLTGDVTDGYKGCPTVGAKTAEKILGGRPDWSLVETSYLKQGLSRDDAIQQSRLARILRYEDWDFEKGIIKLWEPRRVR